MLSSRRAAPLFFVMGASGSGKDSLLRWAREQLASQQDIAFAHRYITRPADAGGENHIALSPQEFEARRSAGLFALSWQSHGQSYGIGIEINQWLAKGISVVVNGSREYLPLAERRYPELIPLWIEVDPDILRERLIARGREPDAVIEARLTRHARLSSTPQSGIVIQNDGPLAEAGAALVEALRQHSGAMPCTSSF